MKIFRYVLADILKNRMLLAYTLLLLIISLTVFSLEDNVAKSQLTLFNLILLIVPLVSIIFSTIYAYNSAEFIELLASQPIKRQQIWLSLTAGLATSLFLAFFIGVALPVFWFDASETGIYLIFAGAFLSIIFCVLAMIPPVISRDKAVGIGLSLLVWLYFSILFDGLLLFLLFQFSDYPMEQFMLGISLLNPIDLARIMVLLKMDYSALMGYTGAVFKDFLGTSNGFFVAVLSLLLWVFLPFYISIRHFKKMDL